MAFRRDGYYYDAQIKTYILQFMAIFTGLQVQVGKWGSEDERLISVPIHYGDKDRVVASLMADNTQNKPLRVPMMSASLRNIRLDPGRMVGTGTERRKAYVPVGGLVPNDIRVIHQRKPVPYTLELELTIFASNNDQQFQMLGQLLPLFDPQLTIQTSDAPFDWTRLSSVVLTNIANNSPYPSGTSRRLSQYTLTFDLPVWLDTPADIRNDFIQKVMVRIGTIDSSAATSFDIIGDLDGQGILYETWADTTNNPPV